MLTTGGGSVPAPPMTFQKFQRQFGKKLKHVPDLLGACKTPTHPPTPPPSLSMSLLTLVDE